MGNRPRRVPRLRCVPQSHPRRMASRGAGCGLQPPAIAQPPVGAHLYPFVIAAGAESEGPEEEGEVSELRPRGREKVRRSTSRDRLDDIVLLTRDIQEGDTLNAIALQYCCSVSPQALTAYSFSRVVAARSSLSRLLSRAVNPRVDNVWETPCSVEAKNYGSVLV